ncbi:hypothetical protein BS78_02G115700 [Paspalum vaginatum]|nr:hypothetical protein BS78_02G115700 [Paspalum vaginatum]
MRRLPSLRSPPAAPVDRSDLMAPRSPPSGRARRAPDASGTGALPPDVMFEVLLHLPVKDLCRFRAVSRAWRSLTSDPLFATAHAARHTGPLFLARFRDDKTHVCIVDLSGKVVKRIAGAASSHCEQLLCTRLNLACLTTDWNRCRVLSPATGAVRVLPQSPAAEHVNKVNLRDPCTLFALGWIASTGEYKVLRMFSRVDFAFGRQQLFEVLTLNGGADRARWRGSRSPGLLVEKCGGGGVVVDGVVYLLTSRAYDRVRHGIRPDYIISFDLRTEEWRKDLQGPLSGNIRSYKRSELTLAELKGSLALAHHSHIPSSITDIWFLVDFENGRWVKEYHIQTGSIVTRAAGEHHLIPLLVLDDGRLVVYLSPRRLLLICDPGTSTFTKVDISHLDSIGLYTGNLLSLEEDVVL